MRTLPFRIVVAVALAASTASGQDPAAAPRKKFDAKVEELRAKHAADAKAVVDEYAAKLGEHVKAATEKGDLDRVVAFKAEKEAVEAGKAPADTAASLKIVQPVRAAYEPKRKAVAAAYERGAKAAVAEYLADLDAVVREETKEGRIDAAIKVREARKEAEKAGVPAAAPPAAKEGEPTPATKPEPAPAPAAATKPDAKPADKPVAFSWDKAVANPAQVKVERVGSFKLDAETEKGKFSEIPERFTKNRAVIYAKPADKHMGVAHVTVEADGFVFVACNYGYQGNSGGDWQKTRWTAEQFVENGWKKLDAKETGGNLAQGNNLVIFVKFLKKGDDLKLRCNKYDLPFVIVFEAEKK